MLDESMAPDASLDEKIITEKVNRKVMSTQKEEADKSFMDQMRRVGKVYCGQLVDNM